METVSLVSLAARELELAKEAHNGRSSITVYGGRDRHLRQTLIALLAGQRLPEHASPGDATLQVISGRIVLSTEAGRWELRSGSFVGIPDEVHSVDALEDATFLLSVAKTVSHSDPHEA
ncbi:MAG: cupin domain-containing protein [Ruaniaceae bacterium]|nr:cupin domain-containing protein [Ruaniaceae bacterium]